MVDITHLKKRDIREVRQGDANFMLYDGIMAYPRAMLHVMPECPHYIAEAISTASKNGWLKCVAHVQGKELSWQELTK